MFRNYLTTALRNLRKNKLYSTINIFGLTVGLAACLLIGVYINHELSYDKFVITTTITVVIALCTIGYHSFRAALTNPVKSLKTE